MTEIATGLQPLVDDNGDFAGFKRNDTGAENLVPRYVTGPNGEVSLRAGSLVIPSVQRGSSIGKSNQEPFLNHATSTYSFLGFDDTDNLAFVNDSTGGGLRQGTTIDGWLTQGGTTWSGAKGWPTNVTYAGVQKIVRFGGYLYLLALDTSDSLWKIWRAAPAAGNTAFTWSAPLQAFQSLATALATSMSTDGTYLYAAEYTQQVTFSPAVYRTADGVTWTTIYGPDAAIRHVHCINPDPYNPGHVWMTCGDGIAKSVQRSTDYGATWSVIVASSQWQAVQISFTQNFVYFAGDSQNGIVYKIDRTELVPRWITPQLFKNIAAPTPAALTDAFYYNAWQSCVDPATGDFYSSTNDSSAGGNTAGLFITREGEGTTLCAKFSSIQTPVVVAGGVLWVGKYRKVLNSYA